MRAHEFITEGGPPRGKMKKEQEDATSTGGSVIARDDGGYDRTYHMNRLWMAMAMADGKSTKAVDMDVASPVEKFNSIHPYTEEEYNMFVSATKTIPTDHKTIVPYSKSQEPEDTNTTSLVKPFKGYKKK